MVAKLAANRIHLRRHAGGDPVTTRNRKAVHFSPVRLHCKLLFLLWIEASHNKTQHEGVWVIKQAKQLKRELRRDRFFKKRTMKQAHK